MSIWYCHLCEKSIQHRGVPRHRQMHKDRGDVFEMSSERYRYSYDYSDRAAALGEKNE